jgi:predicted DNA-binding protein (UPF0251 family)
MDALQHTPDLAQPPAQPSNDLTEAVTLRDLIRDGLTVEAAGRQLKMSRSTVFRRLQLIEEDIDRGVLNLLTAKALDRVDDWEKASQQAAGKGDHRPAKDWLLHAKAIDPVNDGSQGRMQVAIMIGTPEQPIRLSPPQQVLEPE